MLTVASIFFLVTVVMPVIFTSLFLEMFILSVPTENMSQRLNKIIHVIFSFMFSKFSRLDLH